MCRAGFSYFTAIRGLKMTYYICVCVYARACDCSRSNWGKHTLEKIIVTTFSVDFYEITS